jgi:hypothetical protein
MIAVGIIAEQYFRNILKTPKQVTVFLMKPIQVILLNNGLKALV